MKTNHNRLFAFTTILAIALTATAAIAQNRGMSRAGGGGRSFGGAGRSFGGGARSFGGNRGGGFRSSGGSLGSGFRSSGSNRGSGFRSSGGNMASRPSAFRSTYRAGQPIGGRNLGAVRSSGNSQPRNNWSSPRQTGGSSLNRTNGSSNGRLGANSFGLTGGNSNGRRNGSAIGGSNGSSGNRLGANSFGQNNGNSNGNRNGSAFDGSNGSSGRRLGANSFGRTNGNLTGQNRGNTFNGNNGNSNNRRGGNSFGNNGNSNGQHNGNAFRNGNRYGNHNGNNDGHHNNWNSPRRSGYVRGLNVRNDCYPGKRSIIGCGPGYRYSSGYCGTGFGYPYYGGYYGGYCGTGFSYPLYGFGGYYDNVGYDTYYEEGDVFDSLSTDVEITQEEIDEAERANQEMQDMRDAGLQSSALDQFGQKYGEQPAPSVTVMLPEVQTKAREIGEALGLGDRAFEAGSYDKARDEYVRAVVLAGDDASVRIALGLSEYALSSYTDASVAIRRGVARSPALASSEFDLRSVYGNQADFDAHRHMLDEHVATNPNDIDAQFLNGFVQFFAGQREEGKKTLDAYLANTAHDDSVREFIETAKVAMPR